MVFAAVWTLVVLIYLALAPRFFSAFAHPVAMLALDALTMLFWFAGFIALAVWIGRANDEYAYDGFYVERACSAAGDYCREVEAAVVFGAFEWLVLLFHIVILGSFFSPRSIMTGQDGRKLTVGEFCYLGSSSSLPRSSWRSSSCAAAAAGQRSRRARPLRKSKKAEKKRQLAKEIAVHTPPPFWLGCKTVDEHFRALRETDHYCSFVLIPALLCSSCKARSVGGAYA